MAADTDFPVSRVHGYTFDTEGEALTFINARHAVVDDGKTVILTQKLDPVFGRPFLQRSTRHDFELLYENSRVCVAIDKDGKSQYKSVGKWWLGHPQRLTYNGVVFAPGEAAPSGYLNLWRGWAVPPQAGRWERLQAHLRDVICAGDPAIYRWVLAWCAQLVQRPGEPGHVALVFKGMEGAGKGVVARELGALCVPHYTHVSNPRHLTGHFNSHLRNTILLFADEAFPPGDKAAEGTLKRIITEPELTIEGKGRDAVTARNAIHLIMASNEEWVVPAGHDARRYCVLQVTSDHVGNIGYFEAIRREMQHGGRAAMFHDLLHHVDAGVNLRVPPHTVALFDEKIRTLSDDWRWWYDKLLSGRLLPSQDQWNPMVLRADLHADYQQTAGTTPKSRKPRGLETELGRLLHTFVPKLQDQQDPLGRRSWIFPSLDDCRGAFAEALHHPVEWPALPPAEIIQFPQQPATTFDQYED